MVISDPLLEGEVELLSELTAKQIEILKEAVLAGGVIYRYRLRDQAHPIIRFGCGVKCYPEVCPDSKSFEAINEDLASLHKKRMLAKWGDNAFLLSWSGWRIMRWLLAEQEKSRGTEKLPVY